MTEILESPRRHPATPSGPRVPLRVTLVALLVALVAFALLATGATATKLLADYLQDQQDAELLATVKSNQRAELVGACRQPGYPQPSSFYFACLVPESDEPVIIGEPRGPGGDQSPELDEETVEKLREDGRAISVNSDGEEWRLASGDLPDGYTLVVGATREGDDRAISRLIRIELVVGLAVLVVRGAAGYLLVRNSRRPLAEVERTAQAIAA